MENADPIAKLPNLVVPTADNAQTIPFRKHSRMSTSGSDVVDELGAKIRIKMDNNHQRVLKSHRLPANFRRTAELALRSSVAVILASIIQTRDTSYDPAHGYLKKWIFFPDWYYLGGLSYCAIMVVFSMGFNVGGTVRETCQGVIGVGVALLYNYALFTVIDVDRFDSRSSDSYKGYFKVERAFNSDAYWVNLPNLYKTLPWIMVFTVVVMVLPFNNNTRKYAVGTNVYFTLTIINPANPLKPAQLKTVDDTLFDTIHVLKNLRTFAVVGALGALIAVITMCLPYPVTAIGQLREDSKKATKDVLDLLNIIVDAYCFKNKNVENMDFLKLRLRHKFDESETCYRRMLTMVEDAWWEQCIGFQYPSRFKRVITRNYVKLIGSLIADLRTLSYAMQLEQYGHLHATYMAVLQREVYIIQTRSNDLLSEISREIHAVTPHLDLKTMIALENQLETTLYQFRKIQNRTLLKEAVKPEEMAGNMPLNLFLFSLNSFCSTLLNFQQSYNSKSYNDVHRVQSFIRTSLHSFVDRAYYSQRLVWVSALKVTLAIVLGVFMAVYVYGFSASVPSTIAYIMGGHLGGSFRTTVNRVGGVVAGSVVPSVFKFFFVQICEPEFLGVVLSDIVMFVWVGMCMYVYFGRGYSSYAGVVAAFISSDALMRQTDICYPDGSDSTKSIAIASYSSLAQTSVAVIIFIVVECFILPKSAISMLRQNILDSLKLHQRVFNLLFGHHLSSSVAMDESTMTEVRKILQVQLPCKFAAQRQLLIDAQAEPLLWRPAFSADKHKRILEISHRLLNNNYLLFKLVRWFHFRVTQNRVKLDSADIRNEDLESLDDTSAICHEKWQISCNHFQLLVQDNFETMEMVFSDSFQYSDPDEMAVFMQMKEAFRLADKDCSGELNADDVANMLETVFAQSGAVKKEEIGLYVQQFMALVGKPDRETVSFEEFMSALEHGLKLEVEVYRRRKPRVAIPVINTLQTKEEMQSGDPNELETSRCSACSWEDASMLLRREYDVLNVEDFLISEVVAHMKSAYVEWLMADQRYARVSMEEQLLLNCLVSSAESIAKSLAGLEEVALT